MIEIPLTQGQVAVVDDCDSDLADRKWCARRADKTFYAYRGFRENGKSILVALHQEVARRAGISGRADHVDRNGLNCRRSNLRAATDSQNSANHGLNSNNTSGYKGVIWISRERRWRAQIVVNKKLHILGRHRDRESAARAYDRKAREAFGEFAVVNFP